MSALRNETIRQPLSEMEAWNIAKNLARIVSREVQAGNKTAIAFLQEATRA